MVAVIFMPRITPRRSRLAVGCDEGVESGGMNGTFRQGTPRAVPPVNDAVDAVGRLRRHGMTHPPSERDRDTGW
jgi:hypothetical protein